MSQVKTDRLLDKAAEGALHVRRRIEAAVESGELPAWVLDACELWERSALAYGAAMARRDLARQATGTRALALQ